MKNHGLQVAKLSHFKSGPNISVSYVSFLHAARKTVSEVAGCQIHRASKAGQI